MRCPPDLDPVAPDGRARLRVGGVISAIRPRSNSWTLFPFGAVVTYHTPGRSDLTKRITRLDGVPASSALETTTRLVCAATLLNMSSARAANVALLVRGCSLAKASAASHGVEALLPFDEVQDLRDVRRDVLVLVVEGQPAATCVQLAGVLRRAACLSFLASSRSAPRRAQQALSQLDPEDRTEDDRSRASGATSPAGPAACCSRLEEDSGPGGAATTRTNAHHTVPVTPHLVEDRVGGALPALEVQLTLLHVGDERLVGWRAAASVDSVGAVEAAQLVGLDVAVGLDLDLPLLPAEVLVDRTCRRTRRRRSPVAGPGAARRRSSAGCAP